LHEVTLVREANQSVERISESVIRRLSAAC
jgi:hypothetical protein